MDAVVVGAGPVGLFMGTLLAQQGLDIQVLERRPGPIHHSRAIGIHPPALEAFDRAGVSASVLSEGVRIRRGLLRSEGRTFGDLGFEGVSAAHPYIVALPQHRTEAILAARLENLSPGSLRHGVEVRTLAQHRDHVELTASDSGQDRQIRARIVIGADGGNSMVRAACGIQVRTKAHPDRYLMGDFTDETADGQAAVIWLEPQGVVESFPLPGGRRRWVVRLQDPVRVPTAELLATLVRARTGTAIDATSNTMLSGFGVHTQTVRRMVAGRIALVGDAAHQISPIGGQGMNLGWLDAAALAPIVAGAISGRPVGKALDKFQASRTRSASIAAQVAQLNMAMGRPVDGLRLRGRDLLLRGLLTGGPRAALARAYSMRWL